MEFGGLSGGELGMMRTIEVLIAIIIITGAFLVSSFYATLPWPREVSPVNLKRLALTTLQMLDSDYSLSLAAFDIANDTLWGNLEVALSASLPPNVVYNLTVYDVGTSEDGAELYVLKKSISNAESLGLTTDTSSYMVASSNVTFNVIPEKIGERQGGGTLYILNCSDAAGWWITGYTAHSLAEDLYRLLSPYFINTVMVQNTEQLGQILNGTSLQGENVRNAVIINTCGEAVPIPAGYYATQGSTDNYAKYCYILGQKVNQYNWTWASIVGYPFFYVSNTGYFTGQNDHNTYGIYGMKCVGSAGLNSFLRGLNGEDYVKDTIGWITLDGGGNPEKVMVHLSSSAVGFANYYGIYPSPNQTATRAVPSTIQSRYNLNAAAHIFDPEEAGGKTWLAGTMFIHNSSGSITGKFLPIGLTRSADIRITALGLLSYFQPRLYRSEYTAYDTSRLVVLQLGLVGGV